ncbi:YigZ family protein [Nocardioides sp. B-3]|nr:YigZ family protein [Nocardioides sp. B-3]UUZ61587.1 YigZ family protein [Nocardioides sp. B-3]
MQNAMHVARSVPRNSRPNPFYARVKSLVLLLTAGAALLSVSVVSTVASTTGAFFDVGTLNQIFGVLLPLATALIVGTMLTVLFRFAAAGQHSFRRAAPGGFALALMWQGLQLLGALYVAEVLVDTTSMTKTFGLVPGLVGFLFIGAVMAVLAMEINVVIARRLFPRALLTPFTDAVDVTPADRRAYASYARMQRHKGFGAGRGHPGRAGVTSYLTLGRDSSGQVEVKGSRFLCTLQRVPSEAAARALVAAQRKEHWDARHHCSAFVLGPDGTLQRSSDDGEPAGTAGAPMLEVLRGAGVSDVAAVVTRWFGGTLLGAGGLVRAHGDAVRVAPGLRRHAATRPRHGVRDHPRPRFRRTGGE